MINNLPFELIDKLLREETLDINECHKLLEFYNVKEVCEYLFKHSLKVREEVYKRDIYIRGLIEFTNYCKNDCYYCGIRKSNKNVSRYRLTKEEILLCCEKGDKLGFKTFVLQGGEDPYYTDSCMEDIIASIREKYPETAITLSLGERSFDAYERFFKAGANRYLLRHETINKEHYNKLHPKNLSYDNRIKCLNDLKKIGYQVGTGFMVGSPFQTLYNIAEDIMFIKNFKPHMIGIGPFIKHKDTPFSEYKSGSLELTLFVIGILRLMNKNALIPATTALGTIDETGREKGILAGANVVMPNLSPSDKRENYALYDNKLATGLESAEGRYELEKRFEKIGFKIVTTRGDYINV